MSIIVTCVFCDCKLKFPDRSAGRNVRCPKCQGIVTVPGNRAEDAAAGPGGTTADDFSVGLAARPASLPPVVEAVDEAVTAKRPAADTNPDDFSFGGPVVTPDAGDEDGPSRARRRRPRDDDDDDRPSRARRPRGRGAARYGDDGDDDDEGEEPRGRPNASVVVAAVLVGLVVLGTVLVAGAALYWAFSGPADPGPVASGPAPPPAGGPGPQPERAGTPAAASLDDALAALRHGDQAAQGAALDYLARATADPARQAEVAATIDPLLAAGPLRDRAARALRVWGTPANVPTLVGVLQAWQGPFLGEPEVVALELIGRFRDARGAEAVLNLWPHFHARGRAQQALEALAPAAEPALLTWLSHGDRGCRDFATGMLRKIGTEPAVMVRRVLEDVQSPDPARRSAALQWLQAAEVPEPLHPAVAGQFEKDLVKEGGGLDRAALEGLVKFGGPANVPAVVAAVRGDKRGGFMTAERKLWFDFLARHPSADGAAVVFPHTQEHFTRGPAEAALKEMGRAAEAACLEHMNDGNAGSRDLARKLLTEIGTPAELMTARAAADLGDEDRARRVAAAGWLEKAAPDSAARPAVSAGLDAMARSQDGGEQEAAVRALAGWATEQNVDALLPFVTGGPQIGGRGEARRLAMLTLAELKAEKAVLPIASLLGDRFAGGVAREALVKMGPAGEAGLVPYLGNANPAVRKLAVDLLERVGTARSEPFLQRLAGADPNPTVALAAQNALRAIAARAAPETPGGGNGGGE